MSDIKNNTPIEEVEMDEEINKNTICAYENDILGGLLAAADYKNDAVPIEIVRNGVVLIRFSIRPLSEEEYHKCRERHTKYVRNKQLGVKIPDHTNTPQFRNELIYQATIEEDRNKLWNNKDAWKKLDVINGVELVGRILKAGEKDAVCDKLDEISGYSVTQEEVAKN